jgi:hypothetical protein
MLSPASRSFCGMGVAFMFKFQKDAPIPGMLPPRYMYIANWHRYELKTFNFEMPENMIAALKEEL